MASGGMSRLIPNANNNKGREKEEEEEGGGGVKQDGDRLVCSD